MTTKIYTPEDLKKSNPVFGQVSFDNHEQIVFCHDKDSGLKAIIGIHNTTLGPSLGGTRMWNYQSEWEALNDVLRLSRGMTYKSAISGLDLGGGKAVIIGDSKKDKNPELIKAFARYVDSLSGRYITAEDVGTTTADMDLIHSITPHVTGISEALGGSGNPSPVTAYGVFMGLKAAVKFKYGSDDLNGKKSFGTRRGQCGRNTGKTLNRKWCCSTNNGYQ
jgi:leucine dehydrogenase